MTGYGYVDPEMRTEGGPIIVIGPYPTREAAERDANGLEVVEIPAPPVFDDDDDVCGECGRPW